MLSVGIRSPNSIAFDIDDDGFERMEKGHAQGGEVGANDRPEGTTDRAGFGTQVRNSTNDRGGKAQTKRTKRETHNLTSASDHRKQTNKLGLAPPRPGRVARTFETRTRRWRPRGHLHRTARQEVVAVEPLDLVLRERRGRRLPPHTEQAQRVVAGGVLAHCDARHEEGEGVAGPLRRGGRRAAATARGEEEEEEGAQSVRRVERR